MYLSICIMCVCLHPCVPSPPICLQAMGAGGARVPVVPDAATGPSDREFPGVPGSCRTKLEVLTLENMENLSTNLYRMGESYTYIYIHMHMYIYIYMYIYRCM